MLSLSKKLQRSRGNSSSEIETNNNVMATSNQKKVSIRDRLLVKELSDLPSLLPPSVTLTHPDPDKLHEFTVTVQPEEGHWARGKFVFNVVVTEEYNFAPPIVKCRTRLWHPNITEEGSVCLSLLRQSSIDELGWAPTRTLKDVVWGVNALFTDLLNFEDPLNPSASEQYHSDPKQFQRKVKEFISKYC
ncbi:NEDD8-conjugating enzyme UBE2F [Folsomia candida]|uniref:NEDD8-conjugating enzyme UBE2F n=1 Tax=Folsomia candida TaxID=158441 RepID=UPI000B8F2812|nr:NEDD8-conjugating enzyme UBE2F [Folsomia candida]